MTQCVKRTSDSKVDKLYRTVSRKKRCKSLILLKKKKDEGINKYLLTVDIVGCILRGPQGGAEKHTRRRNALRKSRKT